MTLTDFFRRLNRHLQGERRGMGSELKPPTPEEEALVAGLYPDLFIGPAIIIQTIVRLADVSFWQGVIDFVKMKAAGLFGVIIRAGQGGWEDIKFKINWMLAKAAGIPRGSYWFYDSRKDPEEQAKLWWSLIQGDTGELVHVADFEESYRGPFGKKDDFKKFLTKFQALSRLPDHRIAIYTGFFWWLARVGNDPWFRRYQLWLASYGAMSQARIPAPWTIDDFLFWQYTAEGNGTAYGVSSLEIDLNWYCCDPSAYLKRFPLAQMELPPTPPQGEPMPGYIFSITPTGSAGSKVRTEPDTGNTSNLTLPYGRYAYGNRKLTIAEDKFEGGVQVNKAGDVWLEVLEVNGTLLPQPGYIAEIHMGQRWATIEQIGTLPDGSTLPELPVQIVLGDDVTYLKQTINVTLKPK
jgi:GH25 family lysozyme M1 (1,4-beta-N-acetylmuramidase)